MVAIYSQVLNQTHNPNKTCLYTWVKILGLINDMTINIHGKLWCQMKRKMDKFVSHDPIKTPKYKIGEKCIIHLNGSSLGSIKNSKKIVKIA